MAQNANTGCLYTTVQNVSGRTLSFGFLGAHGMELESGEVVTVPGNLMTALGNGGRRMQRNFQALERALVGGLLAIISTPLVHMYDGVANRTRLLAVQNDALGVVDPCWDESGSSDFSAG